MTHRVRHHLAAVVTAILTMTLAACGGDGIDDPSAASVEITDSNGERTSLGTLEGSPLVVNMWATWCKPCVKEMPDFDRVAATAEGVRIVGVNVGDEPADAAAFAASLGVSYEQYTDADGALSDAFGVSGLPATVFISADGAVLEMAQGALSAASLREKITAHFPEAVVEDDE